MISQPSNNCSVHIYIHAVESMPFHRPPGMDDNNNSYTRARELVSRAARDYTCFCTCRLLPISASTRKKEKESYVHTPFLVRINAIEGKVRPSHVHALAARFESRDRPFCQLTTEWRLLGQLRLFTTGSQQGRDKTRSYHQSFRFLRNRDAVQEHPLRRKNKAYDNIVITYRSQQLKSSTKDCIIFSFLVLIKSLKNDESLSHFISFTMIYLSGGKVRIKVILLERIRFYKCFDIDTACLKLTLYKQLISCKTSDIVACRWTYKLLVETEKVWEIQVRLQCIE